MPWKLQVPERPYAAYLFDCDGTLADSMPIHYEAWVAAIRQQIPEFEWPLDFFYSMAGVNVHETVRRLNERFSVEIDPETAEADKLAGFEKVSASIEPIPSVVAFARDLATRNVPRAIGTGAHRVDAEQTLKAVGAWDLFDILIAQEDVARGKPDPETWLSAAERLGVDPEDCLVLEDGELGIQAARAAGMDVVRVPHDWREVNSA